MKKAEISKEELSKLNGGFSQKEIDGLNDKTLYSICHSETMQSCMLTKGEMQKLIDINPDKASKFITLGPGATGDKFEPTLKLRGEIPESFYKS